MADTSCDGGTSPAVHLGFRGNYTDQTTCHQWCTEHAATVLMVVGLICCDWTPATGALSSECVLYGSNSVRTIEDSWMHDGTQAGSTAQVMSCVPDP